jgi:hypothetical protein
VAVSFGSHPGAHGSTLNATTFQACGFRSSVPENAIVAAVPADVSTLTVSAVLITVSNARCGQIRETPSASVSSLEISASTSAWLVATGHKYETSLTSNLTS